LESSELGLIDVTSRYLPEKKHDITVKTAGDLIEIGISHFPKYCDMSTHCQVTAAKTGDSTTAVAREQFCGHVSQATREHAITEVGFSMRSVPGLYNEEQNSLTLVSRVEAGSNTSTVTLRVVEGDEKESLKSETVKYGRESQGTRTRERLRWQEPAAYTKDRPVLPSGPTKARP
jgi:hypothetical protein